MNLKEELRTWYLFKKISIIVGLLYTTTGLFLIYQINI